MQFPSIYMFFKTLQTSLKYVKTITVSADPPNIAYLASFNAYFSKFGYMEDFNGNFIEANLATRKFIQFCCGWTKNIETSKEQNNDGTIFAEE